MSDLERILDLILDRIEAEVWPKLDITKHDGGYDCCGCSTYGQIVDDITAIIRDEAP